MPAKDPLPDRADLSSHAARHAGVSEPYRDLCSNCDNAKRCEGGTRPRRPIFFCEEFLVFGAASAPQRKPRTPAAKNINGQVGLCVNCASARTCALTRPEGGIWHCEEYH